MLGKYQVEKLCCDYSNVIYYTYARFFQSNEIFEVKP